MKHKIPPTVEYNRTPTPPGAFFLLPVLAVCLVLLAAFPEEPNEYCEMWEIWHADRLQGIAVKKRLGWPDHAGKFYEECEQPKKAPTTPGAG